MQWSVSFARVFLNVLYSRTYSMILGSFKHLTFTLDGRVDIALFGGLLSVRGLSLRKEVTIKGRADRYASCLTHPL